MCRLGPLTQGTPRRAPRASPETAQRLASQLRGAARGASSPRAGRTQSARGAQGTQRPAWRGRGLRGLRGQLRVPDPGARALGGGRSPRFPRCWARPSPPRAQAPLGLPCVRTPQPPLPPRIGGVGASVVPLPPGREATPSRSGSPAAGTPSPWPCPWLSGEPRSQDRAESRGASRRSAALGHVPRPASGHWTPHAIARRGAVTTGPPEGQARPVSQGMSDLAGERLRPKPEAGKADRAEACRGQGGGDTDGRREDSRNRRHPCAGTRLRAASPEPDGWPGGPARPGTGLCARSAAGRPARMPPLPGGGFFRT